MKTLTFSLLILTSYVWCAESQHPIPRIEKTNGQVRLVIDGAPFLMLNGQVPRAYFMSSILLSLAVGIFASVM